MMWDEQGFNPESFERPTALGGPPLSKAKGADPASEEETVPVKKPRVEADAPKKRGSANHKGRYMVWGRRYLGMSR